MKLADKLIDRLEEISSVKSKKIPYWITRSTEKIDSENNLLIYINSDEYNREQEIEDTGFSEYFKNENEFIEKLDAKQLDLTYNK